jgi:hypothetical protein
MGVVMIMLLLIILMWKLVELYDEAYRHEWYWKVKNQQYKIKKKLGLNRKSSNNSTPLVKGWRMNNF